MKCSLHTHTHIYINTPKWHSCLTAGRGWYPSPCVSSQRTWLIFRLGQDHMMNFTAESSYFVLFSFFFFLFFEKSPEDDIYFRKCRATHDRKTKAVCKYDALKAGQQLLQIFPFFSCQLNWELNRPSCVLLLDLAFKWLNIESDGSANGPVWANNITATVC